MSKTETLKLTELTRPPAPEIQVSVTPLDMRQARFAGALRGYNKAAVATFLETASEEFERALRENEKLRQEIARLEGSIAHFRELEALLKNTLVNAQRVADGMRDNAVQEAARIVREAEGRAELLLQQAHARVEDVEREVDGLRIKRREAENSIESTIAALNNTLDFIREQDSRQPRVRSLVMAGVA